MARFMSDGWAQDVREAFNAWPSDERKATKLQDFWDWIDLIRPFVTGRVALNVADLPPDAGADGDTLVVDFERGAVAAASVQARADAETDAQFVLSGSYAAWLEMLAGYDVGKMIMYRRLMLEKGDTLRFFMAAFYWTELLAIIQCVPVQVTALTNPGSPVVRA
jgi:hypothetical protein